MNNKPKTSAFERLKSKVKPHDREFASITLDIVDQIYDILESKGWTQKVLAEKMGKRESEVSRLLSGVHNLSILTLAKLQIALEDTIICTPKRYKTITAAQTSIIPEIPSSTYTPSKKAEIGESNYAMAA